MCGEPGMVLPALDQAAVGLSGWTRCPEASGAGLIGSLLQHTPVPREAASLRLLFGADAAWDSAVFVQVAARAAQENRLAFAYFSTSDSANLCLSVSMLSTPRVLGLPDAMSQREGMGVCSVYLWRKSSPHCGEERDWTRTSDSPCNILVEPGNAAVKTLLFPCTKEISIRISLLIAGPKLALLTWCPGIPSTSPGMSRLPFCLLSAEL